MTNYSERLDEVLDWQMKFLIKQAVLQNIESQDKLNISGEMLANARDEAKQAITSLIKELVEEAKPEKQFDLGQVVYVEDTGGKRAIGRWVRYQQQFQIKNGTGSDYMDGYNAALNQFEQNLLKALEEV